MAYSRRKNVARWPQFRINRSQDSCRRRRGGCSSQFVVVFTLLAVIFTPLATGTFAQDSIIYQAPQASEDAHVAGSHLLVWWGQRGDVESAITQLGGVQQCPEGINARVTTELLEDDMATSCKREAAGYDVKELLQPSQTLVTPSKEHTTSICRSEACAAWLTQAVEAEWLPECRYRQSQMSFRSLAETLLRIREDLLATGVGEVTAPNASLFREFYKLNQLANLMNIKEDVLNEVRSPVLLMARQLSEQEDFSYVGSGDSSQSTAGVEPGSAISTTGSARTLSSSSSSSSSSNPSNANSASASSSSGSTSSSSSSSNSNSVGDFPSSSDFNSSDTAGFTSSGIGPHASSTATTTELTPSYAYVVGAWVLFNGSYFFLMRRK